MTIKYYKDGQWKGTEKRMDPRDNRNRYLMLPFLTILPLLKQLHLLPVVYQIKFKLATVTYRALSIQQPTYLVNLLHFSDISMTLRASIYKQVFVHKTMLNTGKRACFVATLAVWNQLPITTKSSETIATSHKNLKTDLFEIAFPP